jgi:hypothetical protein
MARLKTFFTGAILLFVAASVVWLAAKEFRRHTADGSLAAQRAEKEPAETELIVYCFHNTVRCRTCLAMESYTREALGEAFADELDDGRIVCRPVDIQDPGNEYLREKYAVLGPSVVLVCLRGGEPQRSENLAEALGLLNQKPKFIRYVQDRVRAMLDSESP